MKILMVMAHPDDEIICGWPVFQDSTAERMLLMCSSDLNNPDRQWCAHRKNVTQAICDELKMPFTCLDYSSEFYRLTTRDEAFKKFAEHVLAQIAKFEFDYIFTHNPVGEYGHIDHIMLHQIVCSVGVPVLFTDLFFPSNWVPYTEIPRAIKRAYYGNKVNDCEINKQFYALCQQAYLEQKVWTWDKPAKETCGLYMI